MDLSPFLKFKFKRIKWMELGLDATVLGCFGVIHHGIRGYSEVFSSDGA